MLLESLTFPLRTPPNMLKKAAVNYLMFESCTSKKKSSSPYHSIDVLAMYNNCA